LRLFDVIFPSLSSPDSLSPLLLELYPEIYAVFSSSFQKNDGAFQQLCEAYHDITTFLTFCKGLRSLGRPEQDISQYQQKTRRFRQWSHRQESASLCEGW